MSDPDNTNKDNDPELDEFLKDTSAPQAIQMGETSIPKTEEPEPNGVPPVQDEGDLPDEGPKPDVPETVMTNEQVKEQAQPLVDSVVLKTAPDTPVPSKETPRADAIDGEEEEGEEFVPGDLSEYFRHHTNNIIDATLAIDSFFAGKTTRKEVKEIQERFATPGTYENKLLSIRNSPSMTSNALFLHDVLAESVKAQHELKNSIDVLNDNLITNDPKFKGELNGSAARVAFAARRKGIKKVHCLNSGFYLVIQPAAIQQLHNFYREVQDEAEGNGRDIGGHFLIMEDIFLKKKFMEILPRFVIDSNLKNWDRRGVLNKALKIQDYDTVIWAACCLIFKGDIKLPVICTNTACGHEITSERFDFNKFKLIDTTIFKSDALTFCDSKEVRSQADLNTYAKDTLGFDEVIEHDGYKFHMTVPSAHDFIEYGEDLRRIIMSEIHDEDGDNLETSTIAAINHSRSYAPWIKRVDDVSGGDVVTTTDRETICRALDDCVESENPFTVKAKEYVKKTRITHIAYSSTTCPKCNHEPDGSIETDFIAWDAQDLFFHLTCRKIDLMRQAAL